MRDLSSKSHNLRCRTVPHCFCTLAHDALKLHAALFHHAAGVRVVHIVARRDAVEADLIEQKIDHGAEPLRSYSPCATSFGRRSSRSLPL